MDAAATARSRRTLRAGDTVRDEFGEPHELVEQLGKGGQGEVWSLTGGHAAAKILSTPRRGDAERLHRRIAAVRRFDLSGIPIASPIRMLDGERVGYLMELLDDMVGIGTLLAPPPGRASGEWYQSTGGLRRRLRLLTLAAEALHRLHSRALAYCDVSPANVLVSRGAAHTQVWLIDPDNVVVEHSVADLGLYTPGYGAPEVVTGRAGCSTLTDAFSFAVLAFHILVMAHPFVGADAYEDLDLRDAAYAGRLPWIDHPTDRRNRPAHGLDRAVVLTRGLASLARQAFETGVADPLARPPLADWCRKLDQAAQLTITCPAAACGGTYYASSARCSWCHEPRPLIARVEMHAFVPPQPDLPELGEARESTRLEGTVLTAGEPAIIRARNALLCLDRGPGTLPVDPDEPVAEVSWDGESEIVVRRLGRAEVWFADPGLTRTIPVRPGEARRLSGQWTVRFGPLDQVHRLLRFARQRVGER